MKELLVEEKARRYDEALKVAKGLYAKGAPDSLHLERMFPVLKESEDPDEKIRKALIKLVTNHASMDLFIEYDIHLYEARTWLEKQGKPAVDTKVVIPKFRVGDIVKSKSQPMLSPRKIISIGKDCYWCEDRGCIGFSWEDDLELVEQKSIEWSEEDEEIHRKCICAMRASACGFPEEEKFVEQVDNWLKSIRSRVQPQWRPSENELEVLRLVAEKDGTCLMGLYENLKKLREG